MNRTHAIVLIVVLLTVGALCAGALFYELPITPLVSYIAEHRFMGAVVFSAIMFITTVLAPLSALPLVPFVAPVLSPLYTAIACIIGWTLGALVAFLIARYGGRPFLLRCVDIKKLEALEAKLPKETHFLLLVMLRMVIPVDILSYALGLVSSVKLSEYMITTVLGIVWFSFAFAYLGEAFFSQDYVLFGGISVASVIILMVSWRYVRRALGIED